MVPDPTVDESMALEERFDSGWLGYLEQPLLAQPKEYFLVTASYGAVTMTVWFSHQKPLWAEAVVKKTCELLALPENWDSYRGARVNQKAAQTSLEVLMALGNAIATPKIVPTPGGGVQLEWRKDRFELEIEVTPVGRLLVGLDDPDGGLDVDEEFKSLTVFRERLLPKIVDRIPKV